MNILFVGFMIKPNAGGAERYCYNILKELADRGHSVYVLAGESETTEPPFISIDKRMKPIRYVDHFLIGHRVKSFLSKQDVKIDLFICGHIFLYPRCERIARSLGLKYDLFIYGIDAWGNRFRERMPGMKSLRNVVSISGFTSEQIQKQGYTGNIVYFPPLVESIPDLGQSTQSLSKRLTLLTVARLDANERYKGHDVVLHALKLASPAIGPFEYLIAGKGNDTARLQALAKELGLAEHVKFLGFVPDDQLQQIYRTSDIFIMPSRVSLDPEKLEGEGFGIVFTEAALYEKALIGPNTGGSMDIIDDGVNGLTCDPSNPAAIAECITRLARDPELRRQLGVNARQKVLDNFTLRQFDAYFNQLL